MTDAIQFTANHFKTALSPEDARDLFRCSVRYVEIETFTYCNRKCWFCPNASIPSRQDKAGNRYMDEGLYLRILEDLAAVDYCGQIQYGRYNEPLADRVILTRIAQAARKVPKAWLYTHTNGDFLTRDYLDELKAAGLNGLAIQTYLGNNERYDERDMQERMAKQLLALGLKVTEPLCRAPGLRHHYRTDYDGMRVTIDARNFTEIGTDRGALVPITRNEPRTAPCLIPFSNVYIDWDGSTMPCCNLRSDVPEHAPYVVSRLQDGASLFDAYVALRDWRLSLMRFGEKQKPCDTCRYDDDVVPREAAGDLERFYQLATG